MKSKFLRTADEQDPKEFEFDQDTITIGRHSSSDMPVKEKKASRHHSKIEIKNGEVRITDLESSNGTCVNGEKIVTRLIKEGDEITISGTTISVVMLDRPAAVAEPAYAPSPEQADLKKKIDGVKSAIAADRERTSVTRKRSPLLPVAVVGIIVMLAVGFFFVNSSFKGKENAKNTTAALEADQKLEEVMRDLERGSLDENKVRAYARRYGRHMKRIDGKTPFTAIVDRIELAKQRLDEIKLAEFTGDLDVYEAKEYAAELGNYLPRSQAGLDPFTVIALKYDKNSPTRIPEGDFEGTLASVERSANRACRRKEYAEAIAAIETLTSQASPKQKQEILPLLYQTKEKIWKDFQRVIQEGAQLEADEKYEDAKILYTHQAPQFEGTEFHAILASRPGDLDLLVRALAAGKKFRERAARKKAEIASLPAKPEKPPTAPEIETPEVVVNVSLLKLKLTAAINAGILDARIRFAQKKAGKPTSADPDSITLEDESRIAWNDIEPKYLFRMYGKCGLQGNDLLVLAEWAHREKLDAEANRTLSRYVSGKTENRPKVNEIVARWRGAAVPESGYKYNSRLRAWEDASDIAHRIAREDAGKLAKKLSSAATAKKIEPILEKLLAHYHDTELDWETRDAIKQLSIDALQATKKKRLETLEKNTKKTGTFAMLRKIKLDLNVRRAAAIKLIYDESIYLREDHPDWRKGDVINGQTQVDELVGAVRDLWEGSGRYAAKLSPTVRSDVEIIQKISREYIGEFGEEAGEDDLKDFEEVMNNLNQIVNIKSFALDAKEKKIFGWNRRVEKYNLELKHEDITSDEKDHFKVLNDYREMMGRKRLFLEPRLCRACKKHSAAQDAAGAIWHVGSDGSPQSRAKAEGFTAGVGENVALGYATPIDTWVRGWYRASDHHRNGLSRSWNCGGYGYVGRVGSQNFSNIAPPPGFPK